MAKVADNIMSHLGEQSVSAVTVDNDLVSKVISLIAKVEALSVKPRSRSEHRRNNNNYRGRSKSQNRKDRSRSSGRGRAEKCFYHKKFGNKALKCKPGCSMENQINSEN